VLNLSIRNTIMHFNISNLIKILTKDKGIFKSTMLYFSILLGQTNYILKDPMDGFISLKIKMIFKPKLKDMSINKLFLKNIKIFLKKNLRLKLKDYKKVTKIYLLKVVRSLKHVYFAIIVVILVISHLITILERKITSQMLFEFLKLKIRDLNA
jgi:hypothetical protein